MGSDDATFQLVRSQPLLDSGKRIGEIRVARSLTAIVTWTAGAALASGLLAIGLYVILRVLRIRTLERSEKRLLAIMDSAPDAVVMLDSTGRIRRWNVSAATLFGLSAQEMAGPHLSQMIGPSDHPGLEAEIERLSTWAAARGGTARTINLTGLAHHRNAFPAEARFWAWPTDTETSIVGVIRDVTGREKAEVALDESRDQSETLLAVSQQVSGTLDVDGDDATGGQETERWARTWRAPSWRTPTHSSSGRSRAITSPSTSWPPSCSTPIPLKGHRVLEEAWQRQSRRDQPMSRATRGWTRTSRRFPHRSSLFCPMVVQGEPIGGLFVTWIEQ